MPAVGDHLVNVGGAGVLEREIDHVAEHCGDSSIGRMGRGTADYSRIERRVQRRPIVPVAPTVSVAGRIGLDVGIAQPMPESYISAEASSRMDPFPELRLEK